MSVKATLWSIFQSVVYIALMVSVFLAAVDDQWSEATFWLLLAIWVRTQQAITDVGARIKARTTS